MGLRFDLPKSYMQKLKKTIYGLWSIYSLNNSRHHDASWTEVEAFLNYLSLSRNLVKNNWERGHCGHLGDKVVG